MSLKVIRILAGAAALSLASAVGLPSPISTTAEAQLRRTLNVGDKAPQIRTHEWLKGDELTSYEPGQVYVLDFWATWCAPCIAAMPHLSELQEKHAENGLNIVAISVDSVRNTGQLNDDLIQRIKNFVVENDQRMQFAVAIDDSGFSDRAVRMAYGMQSIPATFIVDREGRIAYGGNPTPTFDRVLELVMADEYDLDAVVEADKLAKDVVSLFRKGDREEALALIDQIAELDSLNHSTMIIDKLQILLAGTDNAVTLDYATKIIPMFDQMPIALTRITSLLTMLNSEESLILAEEAGTQAVELTDRQDPRPLAILAGVFAARGEFETAAEVLREAAPLAGEGSGIRLEIDRRLAAYEKGEQPSRR